MKQASCVIVHGCPSDDTDSTYNQHWIPWLKHNLETSGYTVAVPQMPKPWAPDYDAYRLVFDALTIDEDTVLVGHSCGASFLVRWLADTKKVIKKLILVAPWKINDEGNAVKELFYSYSIDAAISERVKEIVYFTSNDEEDAGKESLALFHKVLGGTIIELKDHGHFVQGHMGTDVFPELLKEIVE